MEYILQSIVRSVDINNLPPEWCDFDFQKFSNNKNLYEYQQEALKNAIKILYKYYFDYEGNKRKYFEIYEKNGFTVKDIDIKNNKIYKINSGLNTGYEIGEDNKIPFYNFINRMSFWMATGSGKTLVIVKLIELLGKLIKNELIPKNDILFLTYREDLIEQFKKHIDEFNLSNNSLYINLYNLKDYDKVKRENRLRFGNEIDIFFYRSDLISDEQKDKIVDFRNYDNNGRWYILLDEAHKGDKNESKRQIFYSIMSRNGFLFNFSATFTDQLDYETCVYNFNLEKFIQYGYGKRIFISQSNINVFEKNNSFDENGKSKKNSDKNNDFSDEQKRIIILKIFLLHTLIKKYKPCRFYHTPLILTLVNSVNTEDSDLELFFREIKEVAKGNYSNDLIKKAKEELKKDLNGKYEFDNEKIEINEKLIDDLTYQDILINVFNVKSSDNIEKNNGNGKGGDKIIEVLKIPGNKQEIILKLTTTDKPFALIKIGDISEWIKDKLSGYEINEKIDDESVFKNINKDDSDINILMGSRSFYEGWDSNRPNIILYINIGKGTDAKKFVLQSIGRGVRIEPLPHKRKRLLFLYNNGEIDKDQYEEIKDNIKFIETLFVYGTKSENLKDVIETLKEEKQEEIIGDLFEINPEIKDKLLLIPVYKESDRLFVDEDVKVKFEINEDDFDLMKNYYNYIGDKIALVKYDCSPKMLEKIKESFNNEKDYYLKNSNISVIKKPDILIKKFITHFSLKNKEFKDFKELENEIIHFKQIRISKEKLDNLREKIEKVKRFPEKSKKEEEIDSLFDNQKIDREEYKKRLREIDQEYLVEFKEESLNFKYIQNHYYIPVCLSSDEKVNYITHIIKTKSEVNFIKNLEEYLQKENNIFKNFDWWFFSKIDETIDEVYIPYYQPKTNRIEKFKPDFIFWFKKGNEYTILFVDPKGTEHTDGYRKIDGYSRVFNDKNYNYNEYNVKVILKLKTENINSVLDQYKNFWFDNIKDIIK